MSEDIVVYGFGDNDRSGKVRWLGEEIGLSVIDSNVEFMSHRKPPYIDKNPLGQIPTVEFRGETLIESTAICHEVAEAFDTPKLWVGRGEERRHDYLFWLAAFGENLEGRLVECAVSKAGILPETYFELHEKPVRFKLKVLADKLPSDGYLCGEFTIADILAGYSLRLGVQTGLVERELCEPYLTRLVERPAAKRARVFSSL